jgi:hypothetical protein
MHGDGLVFDLLRLREERLPQRRLKLLRQQVDALNQTNNRWAVAFTPEEGLLKLI